MEKSQTTSPRSRLSYPSQHIKSYVRRDSRITQSQRQALAELWPKYGIDYHHEKLIKLEHIFAKRAEVFLEIGFGSGQSLLAIAKAKQQQNFIGVETHKPGIGTLLLGIEREQLSNLRIMQGDAYDILHQSIEDQSLQGIQIFFPDPWPKRRHAKRKLINSEFVELLARKIKINGVLYLATDCDDYAKHMQKVMRTMQAFVDESDGMRSAHRPIITKFESRAITAGRKISDFKFKKIEF